MNNCTEKATPGVAGFSDIWQNPGGKSWRLVMAIGLPSALAAAFYILYLGFPMPSCVFRSVTGFYCIGCGATRALRLLTHLRISEAIATNLLILIWLPLFGWELLRVWLQALLGRVILPDLRLGKKAMLFILISALVFMLLRNLPWQPFTFLAP